jgi:hypothetical protein
MKALSALLPLNRPNDCSQSKRAEPGMCGRACGTLRMKLQIRRNRPINGSTPRMLQLGINPQKLKKRCPNK